MDFLNEFFMVWMIDDDSWRERGLIHMLMGNKTNMKFDALLGSGKRRDVFVLSMLCMTLQPTLTFSTAGSVMSTSREPKLVLIALMVGIALISAPWYGSVGSIEPMILGAPRWAIIQMLSFVVIFFLGIVAAALWKPPQNEATKAVKMDMAGVAPSEAETASTEHGPGKM